MCDEAVDRPIVDALRADGHEVHYIAEMDPGVSDEEVLAKANGLAAVLVTLDKDFGELVFRQGRVTAGVLLLRLSGTTPEEKQRATVTVMREYGAEMSGSFTVMTPTRVRMRRAR
ncbi:MAG: DUF5615 family PIN-like protein [Longimicrobiales bacterium]|nr:DUF5615 family PIN-like protein [Longimicrobiales bacterium]